MAASKHQPDDDESRAVENLEAELERKEAELEVVIERYERVIDTRSRLRRDADGSFVWTGQEERADEHGDSGVVKSVLEWLS